MMIPVAAALQACRETIGNILPFDPNAEPLFIFDFTKNNSDLNRVDLRSAERFDAYVKQTLALNRATIGIGRYNEDRVIYQRSPLFGTERTLHLGVDIILPAGTPLFSPLDAVIHSFRHNNAYGDYGPTIILRHAVDDVVFYTLYGHLSTESLDGKTEGHTLRKGALLGTIGTTLVNGNWFEHVHFQVIADMLGNKGDFPGVASIRERHRWLRLCPDPNLILRIGQLAAGEHHEALPCRTI